MTNLTKINDFFTAYASKNVAAIRGVMADDIIWRIPGHHPLSVEKKGIAEVVGFLHKLAVANFKESKKRLIFVKTSTKSICFSGRFIN